MVTDSGSSCGSGVITKVSHRLFYVLTAYHVVFEFETGNAQKLLINEKGYDVEDVESLTSAILEINGFSILKVKGISPAKSVRVPRHMPEFGKGSSIKFQGYFEDSDQLVTKGGTLVEVIIEKEGKSLRSDVEILRGASGSPLFIGNAIVGIVQSQIVESKTLTASPLTQDVLDEIHRVIGSGSGRRWVYITSVGTFVLALVLMLVGFGVIPPWGSQKVILVPQHYQTIQSAIDAMPSGATVRVKRGKYQENIVISKQITLIGKEGELPMVIGTVEIVSDEEIRVDIRNLAIADSAAGDTVVFIHDLALEGVEPGDGVQIKGRAKATISDCLISGHEHGIKVLDSAQCSLNNNSIRNNAYYGLYVEASARADGEMNHFFGNGADLGGYAPPSIRKPVVPQTTRTHLAVPEDYPTVQKAVDAVVPGGTITLDAGTYEGGTTIWKPIVLIGQGNGLTIISGTGDSSTAEVEKAISIGVSIIAEAQDVTLEGVTIMNAACGLLISSSNVSLIKSQVLGTSTAIVIGHSALVKLTQTDVSSNGLGIAVTDNAQLTIRASTISNNADEGGIRIDGLAQASLTNSVISDNWPWGIWIAEDFEDTPNCPVVEVVGCTISNNRGYGIYTEASCDVAMRDCEISSNSCSGISISGYDYQVGVVNCKVSSNGWSGINGHGAFSGAVLVQKSTFEGNGTGRYCFFRDNISNGILVGSGGEWTIENSKILNNADWGIAAHLKKCNYDNNAFDGSVTLINNQIEGNKRGDVCLPERQ